MFARNADARGARFYGVFNIQIHVCLEILFRVRMFTYRQSPFYMYDFGMKMYTSALLESKSEL